MIQTHLKYADMAHKEYTIWAPCFAANGVIP